MNQFYIDPTMGRQGGELAGLGAVLKENREKKEADVKKKAFGEALMSKDPAKMSEYAAANPESAEFFMGQITGIEQADTKAKQKEIADFSRNILTSNPEQVPALYEARIQEINDRGGDPTNTMASYRDYLANPGGELKDIEMVYAGLDSTGYKALRSGVTDKMAQEELDLKKSAARSKQAELAIARDQKRLTQETNQLKQDELRLKIQERKEGMEADKVAISEGMVAEAVTIDRSLATADELLSHAGLDAATGGTSAFPTMPGSDAADFEATLEAFDAQNFMSGIQQMKGMGALSEAEGRKISAAMGALSLSMSEKQFRKSLTTIRDTLQKAKNKVSGSTPDAPQTTEDLVNKYAD